MSLEQVFESRVKRAASVFKNPNAGPKKINFTSAELSAPQALIKLHGRFPRAKPGAFYLYQLSFEDEETAIASQAREAFRAARARGLASMSRDNACRSVGRRAGCKTTNAKGLNRSPVMSLSRCGGYQGAARPPISGKRS